MIKLESELSRTKEELAKSNAAFGRLLELNNKNIDRTDFWRSQCAGLVEALKAQMQMRDMARPKKLDEALSWRDNDDLANKLATEALSSHEKAVKEHE